MRWLAVAALLTGCDALLHLDDIKPPPDAPPCTMPDIYDDFGPASMTCGTWGTVYGNPAWIARTAGTLVVTPVAGTIDDVECSSDSAFRFGTDGVFVEVSEVETNGGYGIFQANTFTSFTDKTYNANTQFSFETDSFGFADGDSCNQGNCNYYATGPYVAADMRWLRMLPTNGGATITAQVSSDGKTWTEYGHRDLTPPALAMFVTIGLGGGTYKTSSPVGRTVFQHFDVCQD